MPGDLVLRAADVTCEEGVRPLDAGFTKVTHLYNAMSPLTHRAPGAVGATLDDDRVRAGIIADGVHVHEGALRVAYRQKGADGLALVTDAMEAAGMPPGKYELSGRNVRLQDVAVRLPDGTLADSAYRGPGRAKRRRVARRIPANRRPHGERDPRRDTRHAREGADSPGRRRRRVEAPTAEAEKRGLRVSCRPHREHYLRDDLATSHCLMRDRVRPSERGETF